MTSKIRKKLFLLLLLTLSLGTFAQQHKKETYVSFGGGGSMLLYDLNVGRLEKGIGASLGFGRHYFLSENFSIGLGLEFARYNGGFYASEIEYEEHLSFSSFRDIIYKVNLKNYREEQRASLFNIPLMFRYQSGGRQRFYVALGGKISAPVAFKFRQDPIVKIKTVGYSPDYNLELTNAKFLGYGTFDKQGDAKMKNLSGQGVKGTVNAIASLELGVKWRLSRSLHLYTGAYVDYGFLGMSKLTPRAKKKDFIPYYSLSSSAEDENDADIVVGSVLNARYNYAGRKELRITKNDKINPAACGLKLSLAFAGGGLAYGSNDDFNEPEKIPMKKVDRSKTTTKTETVQKTPEKQGKVEKTKREIKIEKKQKRAQERELEKERKLTEKQKLVQEQELEKERKLTEKQKLVQEQELEKDRKLTEKQKLVQEQELEKERKLTEKQKLVQKQELEKERKLTEKQKLEKEQELEKERKLTQKQKLEKEQSFAKESNRDKNRRLKQEKKLEKKREKEKEKKLKKERKNLNEKSEKSQDLALFVQIKDERLCEAILDENELRLKSCSKQPGEVVALVVNNYPFNSSLLTDSWKRIIDEVILPLKDDENICFLLEGHACDGVDYKPNYMLSLKRANVIKNYLVSQGISPARIETIGRGTDFFLAPGTSNKDRKKNRRVVFVINKK